MQPDGIDSGPSARMIRGLRTVAIVLAGIWMVIGAGITAMSPAFVVLYTIAGVERHTLSVLVAVSAHVLIIVAYVRFSARPTRRFAFSLILLAYGAAGLVFLYTIKHGGSISSGAGVILAPLFGLCGPTGLACLLIARRTRTPDAPVFAAASTSADPASLQKLAQAIATEPRTEPAATVALCAMARHRGLLIDNTQLAFAVVAMNTPIPDVSVALDTLMRDPGRASLLTPAELDLACRLLGSGPERPERPTKTTS